MVAEEKINIKEVTDEQLIALILESGEMELFGTLYDRYADKVYGKVISMVKDLEISKDLTQEILVKTFLSLAKFEGKSKFSTWLYMVTYNYCIDFIRKRNRKLAVETALEDERFESIDPAEELDEKVLLEMAFDRLDVLLEKIPTEDKTLLLMYYQDDMSVSELSEYFELGDSAVKMRLSRARMKIRNLYTEMYGVS